MSSLGGHLQEVAAYAVEELSPPDFKYFIHVISQFQGSKL